jgi:hypothetical protein
MGFSFTWQDNRQPIGMQEMAAEGNSAVLSPIDLIAHNRTFQEGTMQPNLMRASS